MSAAFTKAAEDSKKLLAKPSNDELLELYGLYKVGNGEDISSAPAPGMFDMKASHHYPSPPPSRDPPPRRHPRGDMYNGWRSAARDLVFNIDGGKAKKNAWQKIVDEGISAETAQERYVALVEQLKAKHGFDENKVPEAVGN
ncbi:Acyl-CoA-binding protein, ACBP [Cordyceps militaris CM01]|uniref:Acyl-CoA-binding protein, ACBP n=1 Tax=Cordyceps militaris (strain CM01) TaxID=983644 RepID=G3JDM5_CORMM|nr:Acyl-CoA-binding protein, ACBP [Cordyceps militaris CM01]EGX92700.1 Acyl-CoA-binding protein, ACBP [Cordyceps militaris CM01]